MDLSRPDSSRLLNWLLAVQKRGLVRRIGVSIYTDADLHHLPLDELQLVQLPCSLYDQRLIVNGTVQNLGTVALPFTLAVFICRVC